MEDNGLENEEIDFSIIGCNKEKQNQIDFSVESLLELSDHPHSEKQIIEPQKLTTNPHQQSKICDGSFMRDLGKLEKSISYESVLYNIYESSQIPNEITRTLEGKQESTCTKTINNIFNITNLTKGTSHIIQPDFKHLILDFHNQPENSNLKLKQNFENYFGTLHAVKSKQQESYKSTSRSGNKSNRKLSTQLAVIPKNQIIKFKTSPSSHNRYPPLKNPNDQKNLHKTKKSKKLITQESRKSMISENNKTKVKSFRSKDARQSIYRSSSRFCSPKSKNSVDKTVKSKKMVKNKKKKLEKLNQVKQAVYSQYFGFSSYDPHNQQTRVPRSHVSKDERLGRSRDKIKERSKGKKIVFSKKNILASDAK